MTLKKKMKTTLIKTKMLSKKYWKKYLEIIMKNTERKKIKKEKKTENIIREKTYLEMTNENT